MAGPGDLHLINLQAFPADAAALRANKPEPGLITRTTPPLNVVGRGIFKFPGAPALVLHPAPAVPIGDGLGIRDLLKRTHEAERVQS